MEELNENQRAAIGCSCDCAPEDPDCGCRCHSRVDDDERLIEAIAARVEAKETRRPLCAKCMIATQPCHICGEPRDKPGAEFCSAAHAKPDILADLTAEELRYLQHSALTSHWQTERAIEIAERFEQLAKGRGK